MATAKDLAIDDRLGFLRLDAAVKARLSGLQESVTAAMPAIAEEFYAFLRHQSELAPLLKDETNVARLKGAQQAHWKELFSGRFDAAYVQRAIAVGQAHERIGLEPRWYIGAYCFILERLIAGMLGHKAKKGQLEDISAVLRTAFLDMDLAVSTYIQRGEASKLKAGMMILAETLDREVESSVGMIAAQADQMSESAQQLSGIAETLHGAASSVGSSVVTTLENVGAVSEASVRLEQSCQDIAGQAGRATDLTDQAVAEADAANGTVRGLTEATARISEVVSLVEAIASQTRLLALNATIEAARAGEAGRGFAVVAAEVKNLARQTEDAIKTISAQAEAIRRTTLDTAAIVDEVTGKIRAVHAVAERVSDAAGEQRAATGGISSSVTAASSHTQKVAAQVDDLFAEADKTRDTAQRVERLSGQVSASIHDLQRRMTTILRASGVGDRRSERREPIAIRYKAEFGGKSLSGFTSDLTVRGAFLVCSESLEAGLSGTIELEKVGPLSVEICGGSSIGLHVQFLHTDAAQIQHIEAIIAACRRDDKTYVGRVQETARRVGQTFEEALRTRQIDVPALFSSKYELVPDTDPQQYQTAFTALTDALLPEIIEAPLTDRRVTFCAAVDRNGYLPTHNRKYSQPQRPGDPVWNLANCRHRRIFDDRTGLLAARSVAPCLIQAYPRDMGGGNIVVLKEFDAPIVIQGKHWGAVRLAVAP